MVSETDRLPEPDRKAALDFRRDFLRVWVGLLQQIRPDYDQAEARIRVHAMFALVNDAVRNPHTPPAPTSPPPAPLGGDGAGAGHVGIGSSAERLTKS